MLVVNRFTVARDASDAFMEKARAAVNTLAARPGFIRARLGRSVDEPDSWCLVTEWESVGAYRRALGDFDVRLYATPLLAEAVDEPSAFEILTAWDETGVVISDSDRAVDADTTRIGEPPRD